MRLYPVEPKQTQSLISRDGVRLDADVYYPVGDGPFPVLLMRQPYGRTIASTVVYAHPIWYARHGYIVVIQDVRGRGTSEGRFDLFKYEVEDGYDTLEWAAHLPKSTGQVGMYGFSYQGMTQLYAAAAGHPALKVLAPAMVGYDLYHDWAYENGALLLQAGLGWAIQLAAETARLKGDAAAYQHLYAASRQLPLYDATPARPEVLSRLAPDSFFHQWLDHPQADDYWQGLKPNLTGVDLPMLHIGGWHDPYLRGDVRLYREMTTQGNQPHRLHIGPWGHIPWSRKVGASDFGPAAESTLDALQIRWFDHFLKGQDTGLLLEAPLHWFEMGSANPWRTFPHWPEVTPQSYSLTGTGLASMRQDDGQLRPEPVPLVNAPSVPVQDVIVHDPWRPVPSLGGHAAMPAGQFDRAAIDGRSDVLTYTTDPLLSELHVAGIPEVELYCTADTISFDVCAVLSEVKPTGQVLNLCQGYGRFESPTTASTADRSAIPVSPMGSVQLPHAITLPLHPTCFCVPAGHRLRLSLSAACFPAYAVNPGNGLTPGQTHLEDYRIITLAVHHDAQRPCRLLLPIQ